MYSSVSPWWATVTSTPSVRAIARTTALTLTGAPGRESTSRLVPALHQPQHAVHRIVDVHESIRFSPVAA